MVFLVFRDHWLVGRHLEWANSYKNTANDSKGTFSNTILPFLLFYSNLSGLLCFWKKKLKRLQYRTTMILFSSPDHWAVRFSAAVITHYLRHICSQTTSCCVYCSKLIRLSERIQDHDYVINIILRLDLIVYGHLKNLIVYVLLQLCNLRTKLIGLLILFV